MKIEYVWYDTIKDDLFIRPYGKVIRPYGKEVCPAMPWIYVLIGEL